MRSDHEVMLDRLCTILRYCHDQFWNASREMRDRWREDEADDINPFTQLQAASDALIDFVTNG